MYIDDEEFAELVSKLKKGEPLFKLTAPQIEDTDIVPMDASHASDIERIDQAITDLGRMCDHEITLTWRKAEPIFDALGDARTSIISLAEKLNEERAKNV